MGPIDDEHRSLFCHLESDASSSFRQQRVLSDQRAKLLWPLVSRDSASQRSEPSTVAARQDHRPFVFELPAASLIGPDSVGPVFYNRVQIRLHIPLRASVVAVTIRIVRLYVCKCDEVRSIDSCRGVPGEITQLWQRLLGSSFICETETAAQQKPDHRA
jgi:hypothetical protein